MGFALYYAGSDRYEDSLLPPGAFTGTPKTPSTAPAGSTSPPQTSCGPR
ncbi:hypothetical protein [Actinacidiphila soli]|nr:hypothetical protein [Actinacidiphila soli]